MKVYYKVTKLSPNTTPSQNKTKNQIKVNLLIFHTVTGVDTLWTDISSMISFRFR